MKNIKNDEFDMLIKVGDLVKNENEFKGLREVNNIEDGFIGIDFDNDFTIKDVTEIWTRTNENTYGMQWRK